MPRLDSRLRGKDVQKLRAPPVGWSRFSNFDFRISVFPIFEFRFSNFDFMSYLLHVLLKPFQRALGDIAFVFRLRNHVTFIRVHDELGFDAKGF